MTPHTVLDVVQVDGGRHQAYLNNTQITGRKATGTGRTDSSFPDELERGFLWAPWGDKPGKDDLPRIIREKIMKVPIAGRTVYDLVRMAYGDGIAYYHNQERLETGRITRAYEPTVERFLRDNRIANEWYKPQMLDYRFIMNTFSEMIFSRDMRQVTNLFHKETEFCRLSLQNKQSLNVDFLLYAADFSLGQGVVHPDRINVLPLYQWQQGEDFLRKLSGYKMAWHSRLKTPGSLYYAYVLWMGLFRENGWMDASATVPEVVTAMMKNQVRLKYQILIPENYFTIRYRDSWSTMSDEERSKIVDNLVDDINTQLAGTENAYMSIATVFNYDHGSREEQGKIQIIAIDDKAKKDDWVPSAEKSDAQIVQSLGGHPSMVGLAPEGGKMGAGSGSDKREVYNTEISINTFDQEIILEPLNWIAQYNARTNPDWDITFYIQHTEHTTTNNQESGLVPNEHSPNQENQ
ncbi:hypothetical protein [Flavilitoribacter nigricans]|uniref:Uncharacterized protein n=1 Tax=Flavilitoribacter nigricans (strain ATCC 23147 / DSM 23189 / NBRC 102662 / NCIMB 1420 / SS-2) TaxID=1122177 RepID=A0A2D0NEK8_FLAN2|nr:hypothetical protein [Flavilitoribacter nigricans]PHN06941.1 hypothetical protein CRP01_08995 [Flavilitoribacter nigricans DSM 23189 = NBRC 102662]